MRVLPWNASQGRISSHGWIVWMPSGSLYTAILLLVHQCGHTAVAATVAKTRRRFWILKAHDHAKTVKFRCAFYREMQAKGNLQSWLNCLNAVWPLVHRRFITRPPISLARTMLKLVVTRQPSIIEWYSPAWIPEQFTWNLLYTAQPWSSSKYSEDSSP